MLLTGNYLSVERTLAQALLEAPAIDRITWHAQDAPAPTRELSHVRVVLPVPMSVLGLQREVGPNLPWAEDQFQERVGGQPLNPPPSHKGWPYADRENDRHLHGGIFSHTYPERYWPKMANCGETRPNGRQVFVPHNGIRYEYGDLDDLIEVLIENPLTRQAYLPVWFPEDLAAARMGERVPCSIGYHFLLNNRHQLDVDYTIRSCDFVRHLRDDCYMTMRLLQWVCWQYNQVAGQDTQPITPGRFFANIGSLHCFPPDEIKLKELL